MTFWGVHNSDNKYVLQKSLCLWFVYRTCLLFVSCRYFDWKLETYFFDVKTAFSDKAKFVDNCDVIVERSFVFVSGLGTHFRSTRCSFYRLVFDWFGGNWKSKTIKNAVNLPDTKRSLSPFHAFFFILYVFLTPPTPPDFVPCAASLHLKFPAFKGVTRGSTINYSYGLDHLKTEPFNIKLSKRLKFQKYSELFLGIQAPLYPPHFSC